MMVCACMYKIEIALYRHRDARDVNYKKEGESG